jgi:trimeric autotransporter adhesin
MKKTKTKHVNENTPMKTTHTNSTTTTSQTRFGSGIVFIALLFAFSPTAHAVVPAPDGGYANFTTAEGTNALLHLTSGAANTGLGWSSLLNVTIGSFNTGVGAGTLVLNTADSNTATGAGALLSNTTGFGSTANGAFALLNNTTGLVNTATGLDALFSNTTGSNNTADGEEALESNTTGNHNAAFGSSALRSNSTGSTNIALGSFAGVNLTTGDRNIDIGNNGVADESSTIRIGSDQARTFIAGIRGVVVTDSVPVVIDPAGQLGTIGGSSRRLKQHIKPMDKASEGILGLKPVTFQYKRDETNTAQFGLIAEEVAAVNADLVVRDSDGEIYAVRYDAVNAMLLNEFLKEHRRVEDLKSAMAQQRSDFERAMAQQQKTTEALIARLNEQETRIQKVSAQIAVHKPEAQMLVENQ